MRIYHGHLQSELRSAVYEAILAESREEAAAQDLQAYGPALTQLRQEDSGTSYAGAVMS